MNCIYSDDCPVHKLGIQACERRFRDDCRGCAKNGGDEPDEVPIQHEECGRERERRMSVKQPDGVHCPGG